MLLGEGDVGVPPEGVKDGLAHERLTAVVGERVEQQGEQAGGDAAEGHPQDRADEAAGGEGRDGPEQPPQPSAGGQGQADAQGLREAQGADDPQSRVQEARRDVVAHIDHSVVSRHRKGAAALREGRGPAPDV